LSELPASTGASSAAAPRVATALGATAGNLFLHFLVLPTGRLVPALQSSSPFVTLRLTHCQPIARPCVGRQAPLSSWAIRRGGSRRAQSNSLPVALISPAFSKDGTVSHA
jgi:hypothetical protein